MAVTKERFEQGMTYEEYKAQMTRNRERLDAAERGLSIDPADLAAFAGLKQPLNVLAIGEDWCGDVIANFPIIGRLAAESGKLNVRVFLRDQNPDFPRRVARLREWRDAGNRPHVWTRRWATRRCSPTWRPTTTCRSSRSRC